MKGKKLMSLAVISALVSASLTPAFADTRISTSVIRAIAVPASQTSSSDAINESSVKISKDEAKAIAIKTLKDMLDVEIDEKKFETRIELNKDYDLEQGYIWYINFDMHTNEKSINNRVQLDANTGKVIGINNDEYGYQGESIGISTITEEQAKEAAESFLKRVNPEKFEQVKLVEIPRYYYGNRGYYPIRYDFQYVRLINGIEFERNYIAVSINGETGKIASYNYRWNDDLKVPDISGVITEEEAKEIFIKEANMTYGYMAIRDKYDYNAQVKDVKLFYSPDFVNGSQLDAKEGKIVNWYNNSEETPVIKDLTPEKKAALINSGIKAPQQAAGEMDNEKAAAIIKENIKELLGEDYEVDSLRYIENSNYWEANGRKAWAANFHKKDSEMRMYFDGGQITIDALNGEIISLYKNDRFNEMADEKFEPSLTWEQAYEKAVETIAKYYPYRLKDIKTEQRHTENKVIVNGKDIGERYYYFNFIRTVNGIPYGENSISLRYDAKTGSMGEMRYVWDEGLKFQDVQGTISKEEAEKIFFEYNKPKLTYTVINKSDDINKPEMEVKLVYTLRSDKMMYMISSGIDAFTGKVLDYSGEEINESENGFKDKIKGHWAERELGILAAHGILEINEFEPDKEISKINAIKMIVNAKGYTSNMYEEFEELKFINIPKEDKDYKYLQMAVKYGILEDSEGEFKGDELITREEMAEMLVRLLKYDKIAKANNVFTLYFDDADEISPDKYGFVAIGKGLGILEGSDGKFRPKDKVTTAEFAVAVYKALASIRN